MGLPRLFFSIVLLNNVFPTYVRHCVSQVVTADRVLLHLIKLLFSVLFKRYIKRGAYMYALSFQVLNTTQNLQS